ncbi:MAG: cytochrome b5-like heme/steroid binding domain-containing protein, partial [Nanopusillaceae archaeon]
QETTTQITTSSELTTSTQSEKTEEKFYTMEEVAKHNSRESCWTVIRGEVYDLTQWIDKHPGGADKILALCGKDGTKAFEKKHGGQEKPEKALEQFEIGKLKQ